jgi:hypothetical protein
MVKRFYAYLQCVVADESLKIHDMISSVQWTGEP